MAGTETVLPLDQCIASFDRACLPRILQVCSGVYFQGSVYELSGSEVCLSTGDLVKVLNIELMSVRCEDISNNSKFELPLNYTGLFKLVPEEMPYNTVEEMLSLRPVGLDSCLAFTFTSKCELTIENFTLGAGRLVTMLSIEQQDGKEDHVRCHLKGPEGVSAEVLVPVSCHGEFYECESDQCYNVQEIMSSPHLCSRRFRFSKTTMCGGPLVLSPIYQIQAIMHLRKNTVTFPSSLEVDVVDVTDQLKDLTFVTPLTLSEVFAQPDKAFPTMAEILEGPETRRLLQCKWLAELRKGRHLVLHGRGTSAMVLASRLKGRRAGQYFLVSQRYNGWLRRRPREFSSVYDLYVASSRLPGLQVSVSRNCEEVEEEGLPALSVGEQLEVLHCQKVELPCRGGNSQGQKQTVEALVCRRLLEVDEDEDDEEDEREDESEEVCLPLYMQSHFVEKIKDNKKYKLENLGKGPALPLEVKVVTRDTLLETDPLAGFSSLRLEEATLEPTIQASLPSRPEQCFEIPTRWLNMSLSFTNDPLPWPDGQPPKCNLETVTEVTESFYYEFCKMTGSDEPPPPRPPKQKPSAVSEIAKRTTSRQDPPCIPTKSSSQTKEMSNLSLDCKKPSRRLAPPPPAFSDSFPLPLKPRKPMTGLKSGMAKPNTYMRVDKSKRKVMTQEEPADVDSDHDYELMEDLVDVVKRAQEAFHSNIFD